MAKNKNHVTSVKPSERPIFFPLQNVSPNYFHKIGKFKKFHQGKIEILKNKDKILENIGHSLGALLPWQRPIAKN